MNRSFQIVLDSGGQCPWMQRVLCLSLEPKDALVRRAPLAPTCLGHLPSRKCRNKLVALAEEVGDFMQMYTLSLKHPNHTEHLLVDEGMNE